MDRVMWLASQKAVVVFSVGSCCLCHAMKTFLSNLGVNYAVHELDQEPHGREMQRALARLVGLVGSMDRVMALHLGGDLLLLLRDAGAIWLLPSAAGRKTPL
ncbi:unnamed protein product [Spirodela intermedia]|uniref:Glutaredoxin domain-containing protein n=1 Tax=Spirodela intermedia TaxID=51605 RepID=A0A7I8JFZ4_SPIIN|nr:unnamed protein product [Spirodela intermedia]CAA6669074.1 unnamed protein product [Spirodela intermedia]